MKKFFNAFILTFVLLSGRYQFDAVLLEPPSLNKVNFEIEDSNENLPISFKSNSNPIEGARSKENVRRSYYHRLGNQPFADLLSQGVNKEPFRNSDAEGYAPQDFFGTGRLQWKGWEYEPLDVSSINAKMKKWNLADSSRIKRNSERFLSAFVGEKPSRYLDYTNSQMPFNEGTLRQKNLSASKNSEATGSGLSNEKSNFDFGEFTEAESKPKRFVKRRRFYEVPRRSRYIEIPRDDPLLEYSRVRRFLDHKRAKKHIRMSSTLEAKEAAMSRVLDPNLNSDGILEPHVRKRRGLHSIKRDTRHKYLRLKRRQAADDSTF